ncbi:PKD domain-containing protein [Flavobacterium nitratireducens]|uniref:PKD domain-containing protein n=1 Tax=Flavobacterium nitratireducens TaxID=992289 RepID=UPI002414DD24|nr:PKD domain-containing protein [Flavobacterium nitratireducens]
MKQLYTIILFWILFSSITEINAGNKIPFFNPNHNVEYKKSAFLATPTATITGTTTVCQGSTSPVITFTGSGGTAPYTFTYTLNGGAAQTISTSAVSSSVTLSVPTSSAGVFVYNLESVHDAADPTSEIVQTGSATVTVGSPITADFTFTNNGACSGTTVQFDPSVSGTGNITYSWDFGDGTAVSNLQFPTHQFTALGCGTQTFNVVLTVSLNGCTATKSKTITVKQKPDISFNDANNPFAVDLFNNCANAATNPVFSIKVGNTSASTCISSYSIDWGDGSAVLSNATFPASHTYNLVGAYNMVITAMGTNGCSNSVIYVIKNVTNPSGGIVSPGSTVNLCAPTAPLNFTISNWGANSLGTVYDIDYGDGSAIVRLTQTDLQSSIYFNASNPSASLNFPIPHSYTITNCPKAEFIAVLTVSNACGKTKSSVSNITVYSKPVANFTAPPKACLNANVTFTNTSTTGYGQSCTQNVIYAWDFGDGTTSSAINPTHSYTAAGNYTVTLVAQGYCGTSTPVTKTICVEGALTPSFTLSNSSGCTPLAITTTNTTDETNACLSPTYLWTVTYAAANCGTTATIASQSTKNASYNFTVPGIYTIKLTATNSCGSVNTTQTVEVKKPPTATIAAIPNSCGTATINPTATITSCAPASSTLTYAWSFPGGTPATANTAIPGTITYSTTGTYTVSLVVTNECGASATATQTFSVNKTPTITNTNLSQTICSGTSSSDINLTADDPSTTFSWTVSATAGISGYAPAGSGTVIPSKVISTTNAATGTVTYVVTPKIGSCSGTSVNFVINVNPAPVFTTQPVSSTVCQGGTASQLAVAVNASSGTPSYQWYSNTSNSTVGGTLISGETNKTYNPPTTTIGTVYYYNVVTLSSGGCSNLTSNIASVAVTAQPTISQPLATQTICTGSTIASALSVTPSGGTGTATYQWYSNTTNSNSGGTIISGAINNNYTPPVYTIAGDYYYYVVVNSGGSGCGSVTSNVAQVTVLTPPTITTQPMASQVLCQGETATALNVAGSGGNGAFSYQWYQNNVNNTTSGTAIGGATSATYMPLTTTAGTLYYYCVLTQTGAGCSVKSAVASVQVSVSPTISVQPTPSTVCLGGTPTTLSFTISNGVGIPTYQWYSNTSNSNTGGTLLTGSNSSTYAPSAAATGTTYYYCVITFPSLAGACGVVTTNATAVVVNPKPSIAAESAIICSSNTFVVTPAASGSNIIPTGTTYTWTTPSISPAGTITGASAQSTPQTNISQTLINTSINPAVVTYTVTPTSGTCVGNTFTVSVTVNPAINANVVINDNKCFGTNTASISTNITGGIPFSSGAPYTISWTGPNGFSSSATSISNLQPGSYNLSITDNGNCPFSKSYTITEPNDIVIALVTKKDISCLGSANGSVDISVTGGTGNYTYAWTKNGAPFANTQDISNLGPGNYVVSVSDANNCGPKTASYTIIEPPLLVVSLNDKKDVVCYGDATGSITVDVSGGVAAGSGYNFAWTGPNGFTSSTQNLTNIVAGTYDLIVTDSQACSKNLSVTITQSAEIKVTYSTTPILCYGANNASITATISGGIPPYQYTWNNLATTLNQTNLSAGDYTILVTDNAGCKKSQTITIPDAPIFTVNPVKKDISCFGAHDGSIALNLVGGKAPITLVWSDGSTSGLTRNNLGSGTYTATISDGTPCQIVRTFVIQEPQPLVLSANVSHALDCDNANSGAINLLVSGGTAPFTYSWSNGVSTEDLNNVPAGNYLVTVTDARGCVKTAQYSINRPPPIVIGVTTKTDVNCDTKEVKQNFTAQVSGGLPPYQLSWSSGAVSGANNEMMSTNQNGTIVLNVTDALGCKANYSFNVAIPKLGSPSFTTNSYGFTTYGFYSIEDPVQFTNTATDGFIAISWDFGDGSLSDEINPVHIFKKEGSYIINQRVTYPLGCAYNYTLKLEIKKGYNLMYPNAFTPNKDGVNDYFLPAFKGLSNIIFDVYDTWGGLIYSETGETIKGWDGMIKNQEAENGNYYFKVTAKTFYGAIIKDQGAFVLIK